MTATADIIRPHVTSDANLAFGEAEVSVEDLSVWAACSAFEGLLRSREDKIDGPEALEAERPRTPR